MEQKRTLWIIAAVGVFLLVVLGAALILYSPAARSKQTIANYKNETRHEPGDNGWISLAPAEEKTDSDYLNQNDFSNDFSMDKKQNEIQKSVSGTGKENSANTNENAANESAKNENSSGNVTRIGELTVYVDNVTLNKNQSAENRTESGTILNQNDERTTTIDLTSSKSSGNKNTGIISSADRNTKIASQTAKTESKTQVKNETQNVSQVKQKVSVAAAGTNAKSAQNTQKANASSNSNANAAAKKVSTTTQYWVQVTSLTSRKNADEAREVLGENKIPADVFTYTDSKNRLFYRVRVGPYTTKSEAEYWQTRIAKIEGFKDSQSYVAQTQVTN